MIKLIQSKRFKLPIVYLVENNEDLSLIPLGIPFIKTEIRNYGNCVRMLEYEVLWEIMKRSEFKLNWRALLKENNFSYNESFTLAKSEHSKEDLGGITETKLEFNDLLKDVSYKVDIEVLRDLHLLPYWFNVIEDSIVVNLANTAIFNPNLYTKKFGIPIGDFELSEMQKNIIIIDISGSIPKSISSNILIYAKTFAELFYTDILITGTKSKLYDYSELDSLDINEIYNECGTDNDQKYFKKIVSSPKTYKTAIVFGDSHSPCMKWHKGDKYIKKDDGKKICQWSIGEIISLHTTSNYTLAGYADWFDVPNENIQYIKNWVKYLN